MPLDITPTAASCAPNSTKKTYLRLWRWHFYAGLFVIPFVVILAITGAIYLFKPQLDALHDSPYRQLTLTGQAGTPEQILSVAMAALPQAEFSAYQLPQESTDAVNVLLSLHGERWRVYVHPTRLEAMLVERERARLTQLVHDIHGELLLGKTGAFLVELAASWAIVLVLTGIYLWWPRNVRGLGGVLYPRLTLKGRLFWRDLHSVIGMWIAFGVLFLLLSGLPWTLVWGSAFKEIRQIQTSKASQDWTIAGTAHADHSEHNHQHHSAETDSTTPARASLNGIVEQAAALGFAYPVLVTPPSRKSMDWTVKSNAQNRPQRAEAYFDAQTGQLMRLQMFGDKPFVDKAVGIGVAVHEGQLFGWLNQLLGLVIALGLVTLCISGFMLWRQRAPHRQLGAPPTPNARIGNGFVVLIVLSAIALPALGISLIALLIIEIALLNRWARARKWLGLSTVQQNK